MQLISLQEIERITGGEATSIRELLAVFIKEASSQALRLDESMKKKDWEELKRAAHKMKSSLRLIGMLEYRDVAEQLEGTAGNDVNETNKKVSTLLKAYSAAIVELKEELKKRS